MLPLVVTVDSRNRTSDSASNHDMFVAMESAIQASAVRLKDVILPRSFYDVRTGVNDAWDVVISTVGAGELNVAIPAGSYNSTNYCTALAAALDAVGGGTTFTCAVSETTGQLTITPSAGTINVLWTTGTNTATNNSVMAGFRIAGGTQAADTGASAALTSTYPVEMNPEKYIYIYMDPLRSNMQLGASSIKSMLAAIPVSTTLPFEDIYYEPEDFNRVLLGSKNVDRFHLILQYRDGSVVDLNGKSWTCKLYFE